ncbi:uncharacterized protein Z518_00797 [Rhinocladiella mackenziei CBS 650.93]|uniref:Cytochrome P450 n=1 Tax=Rhinocladiella mackenziei CBS 650.93 TaxID=1442369 RepID=A0A0D2J1Y9_9EURO|nr:uncharacterized protein Z518_00797 [Rhinocladiella mackenziei CBS 650.93]KIX09716.1 hypothetical protein Z518_00797 [Rhinocladiella mackenziei CBS 650.93]
MASAAQEQEHEQRWNSLLWQSIDIVMRHPYLLPFSILGLICIVTRIVSTLRFRSTISKLPPASQGPRTVPVLPYWIPWLGHALNFAAGGSDYLGRSARSLGPNSSIFALTMANSKHNVIVAPSLSRQVLLDRHSPVNMEQFIYHSMKHFWDDRGAIKDIEPSGLWGVHAILYGMLRESFVNTAIRGTIERVEERTWNLISGAESPVDQAIWEREGHVEMISNGEGDRPLVGEASLHPLIRHFVGDIASTVLFGRNFMENNPNIMIDLWEMDSRFNMFMVGLPNWFPGMGGPVRARERIVAAITEHHEALFKYLDGKDPGSRWSDMSDVSSVIVDRAVEFKKVGSVPRGWAIGNGAVLWAMNINANPVIFWMIWYIFSDTSLLQEIRQEIAPYVKYRPAPDTGLPIKEAPKLEADLSGLWTRCPLLKGAFFETMRLEAASMSYKTVEEDFVVTESDEDAAMLGKQYPQSFLLRKGEYVCIPHGVHQSDEKYFRDPGRFDPRRFWAKDEKEKTEGADVRVEYGTMKVWGGGKQMCKGKTFAEREVVLFAAAIIMQWDIVPVSDDGKWVHPGRKVGAGASNPKKDVRVRLMRREGW